MNYLRKSALFIALPYATIVMTSCHKSDSIIDSLARKRLWKGYSEDWVGSTLVKRDTLNDTSFAVTVLNNSTIELFGEQMHYVGSYRRTLNSVYTADPSREALYAADADGETYVYLDYYFRKDSVVFELSSGGLGGHGVLFYHSP